MITTLLIVLLLLWAFGLIGGFAMGGLIHVLLIGALILLGFRIITGRRVA